MILMLSHVMESWLAVLGGPRGNLRPVAQGKNVVANMAKHENPNNHIDLETFKKMNIY